MPNKTILVTGSTGMIGGYVVKDLIAKGHNAIGVDRRESDWKHDKFKQIVLAPSDKYAIMNLFKQERVERAIHLAALAHKKGENDLSFEWYKLRNITCAENVFEAWANNDVPVLFISTVDLIGFVKRLIKPDVALNHISDYGKSKAMAEVRLK